MSIEQLAAIGAIVTSFFGGLALCLRLMLDITRQMKANQENIHDTVTALNGHSSKVVDDP